MRNQPLSPPMVAASPAAPPDACLTAKPRLKTGLLKGGDGGPDPGIFLSLGAELVLRLLQLRTGLIGIRRGDGARGGQLQVTLGLGLIVCQLGAGLRQTSLSPLHVPLRRIFVKGEPADGNDACADVWKVRDDTIPADGEEAPVAQEA